MALLQHPAVDNDTHIAALVLHQIGFKFQQGKKHHGRNAAQVQRRGVVGRRPVNRQGVKAGRARVALVQVVAQQGRGRVVERRLSRQQLVRFRVAPAESEDPLFKDVDIAAQGRPDGAELLQGAADGGGLVVAFVAHDGGSVVAAVGRVRRGIGGIELESIEGPAHADQFGQVLAVVRGLGQREPLFEGLLGGGILGHAIPPPPHWSTTGPHRAVPP